MASPPSKSGKEAAQVAISPKLLELLVCPVTRGPLKLDPQTGELISKSARLAYPVRNGIPVMLADEARPLEDNEL